MKQIKTALLLLIATFSVNLYGAPLKVYILAGQSNMEGHANISTFDYIGKDPKTAPMLKEMRQADGKPTVCDDVWISYYTGTSKFGEGHGQLTAGYGARNNPTAMGSNIGPEFTFGIYMNKILNEPVLIIKTAWGGKSLNTDFRPPSAGPYSFDPTYLKQQEARGQDIEKLKADKAKQSGSYYREMMKHIKHVLSNIKRVYPAYNKKDGYEVSGFVWFQGWNDLVDGNTYPRKKQGNKYDLYSKLMSHFIRDVRQELTAPKMRFVIGVLGVGGMNDKADFREAMAAPASSAEFKGNVFAVETGEFWDYEIPKILPKAGIYNRLKDTSHHINDKGTIDWDSKWEGYWQSLDNKKPEERQWRYKTIETPTKNKLAKYTERRFRDIELPAELKNWTQPDFDDSKWQSGKAPIGKGEWKWGKMTTKYNSTWGNGEFLLMRSKFNYDGTKFDSYRISVLARQGFHVYLNGHKIHTYIWWKNAPYYRSIELGEAELKHLKKGENRIAIYANDHYHPKHIDNRYNAIDFAIEGITKENKEKLAKSLLDVYSLKDRETVKGSSNKGYHYLGSAKIMGQIGKAFAEAMTK